MTDIYSAKFYDWTRRATAPASKRIVPIVAQALHPTSVLDVGCASGTWLSAWSQAGIRDVMGVDAALPESTNYCLPTSTFRQVDLCRGFGLGRRFSLVQCLEVAEHLPAFAARDLVASLVAHGDVVLFSAALPGQGGLNHVNEQPFSYWRELFAAHGYVPVDGLRPAIAGIKEIPYWYRYNSIFYVDGDSLHSLPGVFQNYAISDHEIIGDVSSAAHRLQRRALGSLPAGVVQALARFAHSPSGRRLWPR